ncbi:hypothetical protein OFY17_12170 [Marinomonas sp. C2222]|uniref:Uncharacterized protein n=1 Tax=Marinomonas sargassi TaxID=2984494 RepID=A0ABT2YUS0_9GAMM|nr:hypothetical protein [Marinomonas sargassi]MCV2403628.1 hypothetical protein [Marinomonas sargassi]
MMKLVLLFIIVNLVSVSAVLAHDITTPLDGNLYQPSRDSFIPSKVTVYSDENALKEFGLTLKDKRIFKQGGVNLTEYARPNDLHDNSDVSRTDDGYRVELIGNSDRYYHPILGSADNATGFRVMKGDQVVGTHQLATHQVFETKRALLVDIVPENQGQEILLTVSDSSLGARIEVFSLEGKQLGVSDFIGRSHRWMHLLAVAPFNPSAKQSPQVALVQTPHIGGILKFYEWNGDKLELKSQSRGFSTHTIGSDNLNMAIAANFDDDNSIELLLPSQDFRTLKLVKFTSQKSEVIDTFKLPGRLDINLYLSQNGKNHIWLATHNGHVVSIRP